MLSRPKSDSVRVLSIFCELYFDVCVFQVCEVSAESQVRYELETRFQQLQSRLASVILETEEVSCSVCLSLGGRQVTTLKSERVIFIFFFFC